MSAHRAVRIGVIAVAALVALGGATALVLAASAGHARPRVHLAAPSPPRTLSITCPSKAINEQIPVLVYLPRGYEPGGERHPVVYFLHGLPATRQSYTHYAFVAQSLHVADEPAIVVATQGVQNDGDDREYLDWSPTENWPRAISRDLTSCIDHRFRTIAERNGRALVGLSAGGYGAFNIGLRNLQTFAAIESWSGYFVATDPSGLHVLMLPSPQAQRAATVPHGAALSEELARWPSLIAFYVGNQDNRFLAMNEAFDAALRHRRIPHVFRSYPGGHSAALWQQEGAAWLSLALKYLASGHTVLQDGAVR